MTSPNDNVASSLKPTKTPCQSHEKFTWTCRECKRSDAKEYRKRKAEDRAQYQIEYRKKNREGQTEQYVEMVKKTRERCSEWVEGNRERTIWLAMKNRCFSPSNVHYHDYGGRGITVCARWLGDDGYQNFIADMRERPTPKHMIERRDNEKGYTPDNCYWATRDEQARNKRNNINLTYNGKTQCLTVWARKLGMKPKTLYRRIVTSGWDTERSFTEPVYDSQEGKS